MWSCLPVCVCVIRWSEWNRHAMNWNLIIYCCCSHRTFESTMLFLFVLIRINWHLGNWRPGALGWTFLASERLLGGGYCGNAEVLRGGGGWWSSSSYWEGVGRAGKTHSSDAIKFWILITIWLAESAKLCDRSSDIILLSNWKSWSRSFDVW